MSSEKYFASNNPESFSVGPHPTVEAAIEEYKAENDGEAPTHIGVGHDRFVEVDGYSVVENLANGPLYEELYEDALSDWCQFKLNDPRWDSLSERLTKVLHEWLDEVGEAKSWTVIELVKDAS